jgi:hypothetical protein
MKNRIYIIQDEQTNEIHKQEANCLESALDQVKKKNISKSIRVIKVEYT